MQSHSAQGGMLLALDMSQGTATKGGGDRIANFASTKAINPFISAELGEMITTPIRFRAHGSMAYGYEATVLPELCDAVLAARLENKLKLPQTFPTKCRQPTK
jgi:hypothetical protein